MYEGYKKIIPFGIEAFLLGMWYWNKASAKFTVYAIAIFSIWIRQIISIKTIEVKRIKQMAYELVTLS